jgi:uncharacterized repeat protein (TIGR01451 family)/MYXO-CTERM domain-containing protein
MNRKIATLGYNLADDDTCNLDETGDMGDVADVGIGPLEDNEGPTLTHALLEGSPAIDTGDNDACPNNDQRGSIRPADGDEDGTFVCDIGAFELFPGYTDLHINNLSAPDEADRGETVSINVEAHNTGIDAVTSVEMETTISAELSIVEATFAINGGDPTACAEADGTVSCAIGTMEFDDIAMVNIEATAETIGTATIEAMVSSPDDADETNNSASASVMILGIADLQLEASAEQSSVTVGTQMVVTATISNNGPDGATGVRVSSELPLGTTFVSATPDVGTCEASEEGVLTCALGDLAADDTTIGVVLVLTADVANDVQVSMSVGATETDPDVQNNTSSVIIRVNEPSSDSGCGSCAVGAGDTGGSMLLSLGVLSVLLWRRRRSA